MQYLIDACHANAQICLNLTVCHMTILLYQFTHSIDIFWHNNRIWTTLTEFVLERTPATIKFVKPVFYSAVGWCFIAV